MFGSTFEHTRTTRPALADQAMKPPLPDASHLSGDGWAHLTAWSVTLRDLEEFTASSRALNFDPLQIAAGPVCMNGEELLQALADIASGTDGSAEQDACWSEIRRRFNTFVDGKSSQRVLDAINRNVLNDRTTPGRQP